MRILFLTYHGFEEASGISKKMLAQIKGLRQNGHEVHVCYYDLAADGSRCRYVDGQVIRNYGRGRWAALLQRMDYRCVNDYCIQQKIELVYVRCFMNASPFTIRLFKRLHADGIKTLMEVPTYPYDGEFVSLPLKYRIEHVVDKMFRRKLSSYMDAIVTFSDATEIFGQRTIRISNGVDFDSLPLHHTQKPIANSPLHLIGVAEVHPWHGFDRMLTGLGEFYQKGGEQQLIFHIVGGVSAVMMNQFRVIIDKYNIEDKVIFHGKLFGKQLDDVFAQCQFAIGSLARHRSGITCIKTLKNREYAARGIPFIYSEDDSDFDQQPYVLKAPADESPIDIDRIIRFLDNYQENPADIRHTVEHLAWKMQMQRVVNPLEEMEKRIVYVVGDLSYPNGMSRVLSQKVNYLAEHTDYKLYVVLTEKASSPFYYDLSSKVSYVNFDINFDDLYSMPLLKRLWAYNKKQRYYKRLLAKYLMQVRPDITVSVMRREINFINDIADGSKKVGELHFNKKTYRTVDFSFLPSFVNEYLTKRWQASLEREIQRLDKFVVLTHEDFSYWKGLTNIEVIPNPIYVFPEMASPCDSHQVIAVGRYTWQKGFDLLITAWYQVAKHHPNWQLCIFGAGDSTLYRKKVEELNLQSSLICEGATKDVYQKYIESSIFVLSSRFEGLPLVMIEAMSAGLPCVSFTCPCGPRDVIKDGEDGLLIEAGNVDKLAEGICLLIENESLRKQMGTAARRNVVRFQESNIMHCWIKLFESL